MTNDLVGTAFSALFTLAFLLAIVLLAVQLVLGLECLLTSGWYYNEVHLGPWASSWGCGR